MTGDHHGRPDISDDRRVAEAAPIADLPPIAARPVDSAHVAGAQAPRYGWLTWSPVVIAVLLVLDQSTVFRLPVLPLIVAWLALMALNAIRVFPLPGSPARRRLALLGVLVLPLLASIAGGPIPGFFDARGDAALTARLVAFQNALPIAAVAIPVALMPVMRGGRRFTLILGLIALLLTFLAVSINLVILAPGS